MAAQLGLGLDNKTNGVFSNVRTMKCPPLAVPSALTLNERIKMDGLELLGMLEDNKIPTAFFDPQFRGVYDKMKWQRGHEPQSCPGEAAANVRASHHSVYE